jgi:hypothetical protein
MKNFKYVVDNGRFVYITDELGRVKKAIMEDVDFATKGRQQDFQQHTKNIKDGKPDDHGGHIFRNEWGGLSEQINYFSQNAIQNKPGGDWFKMEQAISNFKKANPNTKIKMEVEFNFNGNSKRPTSADVDVYVNGQKNNILSKVEIPNP